MVDAKQEQQRPSREFEYGEILTFWLLVFTVVFTLLVIGYYKCYVPNERREQRRRKQQ